MSIITGLLIATVVLLLWANHKAKKQRGYALVCFFLGVFVWVFIGASSYTKGGGEITGNDVFEIAFVVGFSIFILLYDNVTDIKKVK